MLTFYLECIELKYSQITGLCDLGVKTLTIKTLRKYDHVNQVGSLYRFQQPVIVPRSGSISVEL